MFSDRVQRLLMWIIAVLVVGGTALALRFSRGYRPLVGFGFSGPTDLPADIALRFQTVHVVGRSDGRAAWSLHAGQVQTTSNRSRLDFSNGITATLLDSGRPHAIVTGSQATYDANARVLVAAGNILCRVPPKDAVAGQASAPGDLRIEAGEVIWNVGSSIVSCPGPVHVSTIGAELKGSDLAVNLLTRERSLHQFSADFALDEATNGDLPSALKRLAP